LFGPGNRLFSVTGDLQRSERTQNFTGSNKIGRHGAVLRMSDLGKALKDNPFYNRRNKGAKAPLNEIYAYGVRNSFGIAIDPLSAGLWDTENGPNSYDEINRLPAGSNSGWVDLMGPRSRHTGQAPTLVSLGARARYIDPQLSWQAVVAPTDLEFFQYSTMGASRKDDLFVGDIGGTIYNLNLTADRKALALSGSVGDRVIDNQAEKNSLRMGQGFGIITDLVSRPDGLYVLNLDGELFRIATAGTPGPTLASVSAVPEPAGIGSLVIGSLLLLRRAARGKRIEE
jgi:glucose/arabinose dehydrogenase